MPVEQLLRLTIDRLHADRGAGDQVLDLAAGQTRPLDPEQCTGADMVTDRPLDAEHDVDVRKIVGELDVPDTPDACAPVADRGSRAQTLRPRENDGHVARADDPLLHGEPSHQGQRGQRDRPEPCGPAGLAAARFRELFRAGLPIAGTIGPPGIRAAASVIDLLRRVPHQPRIETVRGQHRQYDDQRKRQRPRSGDERRRCRDKPSAARSARQ